LDPVGVAASVVGVLGLTYGLIEAGRDGWGDGGALMKMIVGVAVLVGFVAWERRLGRRPGGQPLVDLTLFGSPSYTWGVILAAIAVLAMIGVLFTMPQYFQAVTGTDAMGFGVRLLPLIGGLVVGAMLAAAIARLIGAKVTVALGFTILAAGLILGTETAVRSSDAFMAAWMALVGGGTGLAMATATSAALSELSEERSGVGSAVLQALNKMGAPLGTAITGSVLSSAYLARLDPSGLSAAGASTIRQSVFDGVAVAHQIRSSALLDSVRGAFVYGSTSRC
jgi:MFS transporter, DHA2 family, multidrug resistance protein